jgi:formate hydrogenlyase subunit 4
MVGTGISSAVQVAAVAMGGPVLVGVMRKVRSRLEGRVGPPVLQPLVDIRKLFRKQRFRPDQATWIFGLAPVVLVATVAVAAAITPLVTTQPALRASSDLFVLVYLLLVGSTLLALAGLDAGTAFGGMGRAGPSPSAPWPSRRCSSPFWPWRPPPTRRISRPSSVPSWPTPGRWITPQRLFALGALLIVIVAESGRLPVDNPATHLELTMVHEAMILEYAGPDLALVTVGEAMRLTLLLGIFVNLVAPWGVATSTSVSGIVVGSGLGGRQGRRRGRLLAVFEVFIAKVRLFRIPELLAGAFVLALLGVVSGLVVK